MVVEEKKAHDMQCARNPAAVFLLWLPLHGVAVGQGGGGWWPQRTRLSRKEQHHPRLLWSGGEAVMIRPDQIPDAMLNAWPGAETRPTFTPSRLILPLPQQEGSE